MRTCTGTLYNSSVKNTQSDTVSRFSIELSRKIDTVTDTYRRWKMPAALERKQTIDGIGWNVSCD